MSWEILASLLALSAVLEARDVALPTEVADFCCGRVVRPNTHPAYVEQTISS